MNKIVRQMRVMESETIQMNNVRLKDRMRRYFSKIICFLLAFGLSISMFSQTFIVTVNGNTVGTYNKSLTAVYQSAQIINSEAKSGSTTIYARNNGTKTYYKFQGETFIGTTIDSTNASSFVWTYDKAYAFCSNGTVYGAWTNGKNNSHIYNGTDIPNPNNDNNKLELSGSYVYKKTVSLPSNFSSMSATLDLTQVKIYTNNSWPPVYPSENLYVYGHLEWKGNGGFFEWGFRQSTGNTWQFFASGQGDGSGPGDIAGKTISSNQPVTVEWKLEANQFALYVSGSSTIPFYSKPLTAAQVLYIRNNNPFFLMATSMCPDYGNSNGDNDNKITDFCDGTFLGPVKWKDCKINFQDGNWWNFWQSDTEQSIYCSSHTVQVLQPNSSQNPENSEIITLSRNGSFSTTCNISTSSNPTAGGTTSGEGTKTIGTSCTVTAQANPGYTFTKWTENGLDVSTISSYTFTVSPARNLVANFTQSQQKYIINFNAQGGTVSISSQNVLYGAAVGTLPTPTRTGYTFGGWWTGTNGSGTQYTSTTIYNTASDITLYAKWTPITYTVAYNGNGNTGGSTTTSSHTYDVAKVLTSNGFTRSYTVTYNYNGNGQSNGTAIATYTFNNWNTLSSGGGTTYTNGQSIVNLTSTNGATVNLYAQWNTGSVTLPTPNARTGYTFAGWYTAASGGTNVGGGGATYTPTAAITLYAQWTSVPTYTINTSSNPTTGGSTSGGGSFVSGNSCTIKATANTGYTFTNWTENGTVVSSSSSYTFTVSATRTLVANFTPITYTVAYNGNGNTGGSTASSTHTYDVAKALTGNGFTRTYTVTYNYNGNGQSNGTGTATYTFKDWNTLSGGGGTTYTNGQSVINLTSTNGTTITLYAQWNSGSVTLPTPNARTGYTFAGWYTAASGGTYIGGSGATYTPTAAVTLYAQWTTNPVYTISTSSNPTAGGSTSGGGANATGASCTVNATANSGYSFVNWTENGSSVSTNSSYTFTVSANRNLVANFTPQPIQTENGVIINGIKWATRNVDKPGTFAANPESTGMFYQWNRKTGWSGTDPMINSNGGTTWDTSQPTGTTWTEVNDPSPTGWRLPTSNEINSLISSGAVWTQVNGVYGYRFGNGSNTIFMPAAGFRDNAYSGKLAGVNDTDWYWSSAKSGDWAQCLYAPSNNHYMTGQYAANGFCVRSVAKDPTAINEIEKTELTIYPNPTKNELFIKTDLQIKKIEICDLSGRNVKIFSTTSVQNGVQTISLSSLLKGIYLVKVYTDNGITVSKIVKE